ncbi:hypothetical protein QYE76_054375 [Lolium multiflorum]|uniref:Uncharacterized protein n=1 Tax=Lolium multiflorum TaxID=4521 RepID=A0AAD8SZ17_LOLMU|nr:hypothetical protein QYE76_054375 [Lolium multiflorum]
MMAPFTTHRNQQPLASSPLENSPSCCRVSAFRLPSTRTKKAREMCQGGARNRPGRCRQGDGDEGVGVGDEQGSVAGGLGVLPPALDLDSFPCVEEAIRVADEFCDQYRALKREVEILQEENQRLRRMLEYYSIPSTRPSPPHSDSNESLQVLVQNCKIEKLKLKEILMKREKNPSPSPPKE